MFHKLVKVVLAEYAQVPKCSIQFQKVYVPSGATMIPSAHI